VPLQALGCFIQEFFRYVAAVLRGVPHYSHAILNRIGDRAGGARGLVGRFGDVFSCIFN
jgi:hypothetical protein